MKRTRTSAKKYVESSDSEDDRPLKKPSPNKKNNTANADSSSSESDIETYLHRPEKLNFDSEFFATQPTTIEKNILAGKGVKTLSDSESDSNNDAPELQSSPKGVEKQSFNQFVHYTKQMEEAKKQVEIYKAKKQAQEQQTNIFNLLAVGEGKSPQEPHLTAEDFHDSDFESCDSEREDWEEIKNLSQAAKPTNIVPSTGLQITVDMPDVIKKKKGVDLVAAMKRRLNRIRKENQLFVHKVHLLCWIAHGNYVNTVLNDTQTLALALSLLPSGQSYPNGRTDLAYLEQITSWYHKTVENIERPTAKNLSLADLLQKQINTRQAYNKKMLALIFVAILRALGIQARVVMSLQVEPLRPPSSDLHSLSTKTQKKCAVLVKNGTPEAKVTITIQKPTPVKKNPTVAKDQSEASKSKSQQSKAKGKGLRKVSTELEAGKVATKSRSKSAENQKLQTKRPHKRTASTGSKDSESNEKNVKSESHQDQSEASKSKSQESKAKVKGSRKVSPELKAGKIATKSRSKSAETKRPRSTGSKDSQSSEKDVKSESHKDKSEASKSQESKAKGKGVRQVSTELEAGKVATKSRSKSAENKKLETKRPQKRTASTGSKDSERSERAVKSESQKAEKSEKNNNLKPAEDAKPKLANLRKRKSASRDPPTSVPGNPSPKMQKIGKKPLNTKKPEEPKPETTKNLRSSKRSKTILQIDGMGDSESESETPNQRKTSRQPEKAPAKPNLKALKLGRKTAVSDSDSEFEPSISFSKRLARAAPDLAKLKAPNKPAKSKTLDVKRDIVGLVQSRMAEQKQIARSRMVKKGKSAGQSDSDSDYAPGPVKKQQERGDDFKKTKVKRRIPAKPGPEEKTKKQGCDVWVEVFLESEEKWITVDVMLGQVHCIKNIAQRATHPIAYVLAWDNNSNVKDVTQRYCQNFNTITRKLRIDQKWWSESLKPFQGALTARDREEDEDLARQQLDQPLPKVISEYKGHPLYALKRHLLKFEAIYPPEPPTLGFVRKEPVYPRTCVYTLHSRDIWLKQAKVVRMGEQPYKIVKARPKWDKLSNQVITDQLLEVFGPWQVQDYEPPSAENGVVPRNAFGNVDLFKPCMLPKGCSHLRLPGLNKIAKKLNIDCASAIVGFDFHGGWSHPCYDGFIVCKEYEDQLICAWDNEQEEMERKEQMQHDKRVYGNWKKLIRGLLIRERLKARYDFGAPSTGAKQPKTKAKKVAFCTKKS